MNFEHVIFGNLLHREDYGRKVVPFLKSEYFTDKADRVLFELIEKYTHKFNRFPTKEVLAIDLDSVIGLDESTFKTVMTNIEELSYDPNTNIDWIVEKTEKFCQEKAVYNAIMQSIMIIDGKDQKNDKGAIPQILNDALAISFDTNIGHNFIDDASSRYDFYHRVEDRIPFRLEYFNKITKNGFTKKTLNCLIGATGTGKTLFMCDFAAGNLLDKKNVLYITLEMSEERIAERIDANLMGVTLDEIEAMTKEEYLKKIDRVKTKSTGRLIIKEYPTSSASANNFRYLLNELKLKKNFVPDIIYIDYLNICASSRIKLGSNVNSYSYVKSIAEELRGLAVEFNMCVVTATQTNRGGANSSDLDMTDTSESFGLPMTVDSMFAIIRTEELDALNQVLIKQLKNRYRDMSLNKRFMIGLDRPKFKLYDIEQDAQNGLVDDRPVMDKSEFGERDSEFFKSRSKFDRNKMENFK
jgi:archaellum biogenesis ATPase FlaH